MPMRRLVLILLIALGLAPGTWLRTPNSLDVRPEAVVFAPQPVAPGAVRGAQLLQAWVLNGPHPQFGGFSAIAWRGDGGVFLLNDAAFIYCLPLPGFHGPKPCARRLQAAYGRRGPVVDTEGMTLGGFRRWVTYESANAVSRLDLRLDREAIAYPRQMRDWGLNSGAESIVRLFDGRFVILEEGNPFSPRSSRGLLFRQDPVVGEPALEFTFQPPRGFRPVDIAQMPDGRLLVLLRRLHRSLPPRFDTAIALVDPAQIRAGQSLPAQVVVSLQDRDLADNYEGIAASHRSDGAYDLWLVSDDNHSIFQRTLLLRLRWQPPRN